MLAVSGTMSCPGPILRAASTVPTVRPSRPAWPKAFDGMIKTASHTLIPTSVSVATLA